MKRFVLPIVFFICFAPTIKAQTHEEIINTLPEELIDKFGEEKALRIMGEHTLIEINKIRVEHHLKPIVYDTILSQAAQYWTMYMAKYNHFSHTSKEGLKYPDIVYGIDTINNADYWPIMNNLGFGILTIKQFLENQKNSPPHWATIIEKQFNYDDDAFSIFGFGYNKCYYMIGFARRFER